MSTLVQPPVVAPASARTEQSPTRLQTIGRAIWRALERAGQRRAAHELRQLALRWEAVDPVRAKHRAAGRTAPRPSQGAQPCSR